MTAYTQVLIIEDDAVLRNIITRNLEARGCDVSQAGTAESGIAQAVSSPPDLMLLDIDLPDRSGWDVLRELRQRGAVIPTVIISGVRVSRDRLVEFQPLAYLPKPFPLEALLRIVGNGKLNGGDLVEETSGVEGVSE